MGNKLPLQSRRWWKVLYAFGIEILPVGERKFTVRLRRRLGYILGGLTLFIFISLLGLSKYSESPQFCVSCHIMEPYYKAWKGSKHSGVACVECHYPVASAKTLLWKKYQNFSMVVKYFTQTYSSKPYAEVDDSSCLQCHDTRLLEGKLVTKNGIHFDHRDHLTTTRRDRKLTCTSCHAQMTVGNHMEVTWNTCYLCHFKGMKSGREFNPFVGCLSCHDLPDKSVKLGNMTYNHKDFVGKRGVNCMNCHQDVVQGTGEAAKERCFSCHNQPEKLGRIKDTAFIHENHITKHKVACFHCHTEIRHQFSAPGKKELAYDCTVCHLNKHGGQKEFYRGVGAKGVADMPSPMYLANVDCVGCHIVKAPETLETHFKGANFKGSVDESCVKCHGEKYRGMTSAAKAVLSEELKAVKSKLDLAKSEVDKRDLSPKEMEAARKALDDSRYNIAFVEAAHSVHNIYYAAQILRKTDLMITEIGEKNKIELPDISDHPLMSGAFCATMCHAKVGVKVPPEFVKYQGRNMPHLAHTRMISCVKCHEFGSHKNVQIRFRKEDCKICHEL